uniref:Envelope protein E n=1 Tax=Panagrellus redivivus TaxID=6233 RepID=A0A7E4WBD6_PANRE
MSPYLGLHGHHFLTIQPLATREEILETRPSTEKKSFCLKVLDVSQPVEVKTRHGDTIYVRVTFCGKDEKLTIAGHAYGKCAERTAATLRKDMHVVVTSPPQVPDNDLFATETPFAFKLNLDTRVSCAGIMTAPTDFSSMDM